MILIAVDKFSTADIKGDVAQRLRCPGCTRTFAQVEGRNKVELDRKETMGGDRHAITFVCNECRDNDTAPVFAFRLVGGLIQEVRVEDLPDLSPSKAEYQNNKRKSTKHQYTQAQIKNNSDRKPNLRRHINSDGLNRAKPRRRGITII